MIKLNENENSKLYFQKIKKGDKFKFTNKAGENVIEVKGIEIEIIDESNYRTFILTSSGGYVPAETFIQFLADKNARKTM